MCKVNLFNDENVEYLPIEQLDNFENHPFKLYTEERLEAMKKSIQDYGIITPIIVRVKKMNGRYEILSGHNRVNAARLVGLKEVPAMIKEVRSDTEALLIVTETNFMQRSFKDMSYSERALTIFQRYQAMKRQGRRRDLLEQIESLTGCAAKLTSRQSGEKLAEEYHLAPRTISRYLRIYELHDELKERLDREELSFIVGETLSYLKNETQQLINDVLKEHKIKITTKQAQILKQKDMEMELTLGDIQYVLLPPEKDKKLPPVKLSQQLLKKYFGNSYAVEEIEIILEKALNKYFKGEEI